MLLLYLFVGGRVSASAKLVSTAVGMKGRETPLHETGDLRSNIQRLAKHRGGTSGVANVQ